MPEFDLGRTWDNCRLCCDERMICDTALMVFVVFYVFFTLSKNCVTPENFNGPTKHTEKIWNGMWQKCETIERAINTVKFRTSK